jgi:predicted DNA-binding antitoxin AbrB/MazE fold protein
MNQQTVNAIYQNGVLRPVVSLDLPENAEVELEVKIIQAGKETREQIGEMLVRKGLSLRKKATRSKQNLSTEERKRLAGIFSAPKTLGELIDEDREERF